jgi:hypothetical protein
MVNQGRTGTDVYSGRNVVSTDQCSTLGNESFEREADAGMESHCFFHDCLAVRLSEKRTEILHGWMDLQIWQPQRLLVCWIFGHFASRGGVIKFFLQLLIGVRALDKIIEAGTQ